MRYKADWAEAKERLTTLWRRGQLDRPCISVMAPSGKAVEWPKARTHEERWIDPDHIVKSARAHLEGNWWGGEAVPSWLLMSGWVVCFGGKPQFDASTIWFDHVEYDFSRPPKLTFNPQGVWEQRYEACLKALLEMAAADDFQVGQSCIMPANDVLSMQMGTESFLYSLMDHPDWMRGAIEQGARAQREASEYYAALVRPRSPYWYGNSGWMPFWAPDPYGATQSDVSCMLSPEAFDTFILPELRIHAGVHGALWYHLDGRDARQHLPSLLSIPELRVVQYTPTPAEPPNGPEHLAFYRQVQAAGRIVHIQLPVENVEPLVRQLDPGLLMLDTRCGSVEQGRELLASARRWAGERKSAAS